MVWGKTSPLDCVSETKDGAPLLQMCEWGRSGFTRAPESWDRLCGEPTAACSCSCSCCIIHANKLAKEISWGSPGCNLLEEPTGADGAGHTCGQTLLWNPDPQLNASRGKDRWEGCCGPSWPNTVYIPFLSHFNSPLRGRLLLGNPASLLHRCSAVLLLPCSPSFAPGLGRARLTRAPSSLQAQISSPLQRLQVGGSQEDENVEDTALPKAWRALLFLVASVCWPWPGEYWLPTAQFLFCLCGCYSSWATGIQSR